MKWLQRISAITDLNGQSLDFRQIEGSLYMFITLVRLVIICHANCLIVSVADSLGWIVLIAGRGILNHE